jgi:hypothetical protein
MEGNLLLKSYCLCVEWKKLKISIKLSHLLKFQTLPLINISSKENLKIGMKELQKAKHD